MCHDTLWDLGSSDREGRTDMPKGPKRKWVAIPPAGRDWAKGEGEMNLSADQLPCLPA
jgi:hypothetical protein